MKRSRIKPGAKSLARGSTFANQGTGLQRKPGRLGDVSFKPASAAQRRKVQLQTCAVCPRVGCDPAHLTPRSFRGCDHADCVIALCREHHRQFDDGRLDLLPFLSGQGYEAELAHMQGHYSDPLSVVFRLSGTRWVPEQDRRAA